MWSPANHLLFPKGFQKAALTMLVAARRIESPLYQLPEPVVVGLQVVSNVLCVSH